MAEQKERLKLYSGRFEADLEDRAIGKIEKVTMFTLLINFPANGREQ